MKPYCRNHRKASELPPSEEDRAHRVETPFSSDWEHVFEGDHGRGNAGFAQGRRPQTVPYTESQAIMEAAPGQQIPNSIEGGHSDHERIVDAIDRLSDRHRWIFNAIVIEGRSLRSVGTELSIAKTHIARLRDEALAELQTELKDMV